MQYNPSVLANLMLPLIIETNSENNLQHFIAEFIKKNKVQNRNVFNIYPEGKEISILQIRELKKRIIYEYKETQIFFLHEFDKASFEAQNACLKILEEHRDNIQFILIVKNHRALLPTVLSRSKVLKLALTGKRRSVSSGMEGFLETGDLKIMNNYLLSRSGIEVVELIDDWIELFRALLKRDKNAPLVLKEIVNVRHLLINNNLNPQLALDHILLCIRKVYKLDN